MLLRIKLKKRIKSWLSNTIPIEIEINLMLNNKMHQRNSKTLLKLKEFSLIKRRENNMIVAKWISMEIKEHTIMMKICNQECQVEWEAWEVWEAWEECPEEPPLKCQEMVEILIQIKFLKCSLEEMEKWVE